MNKRAITLSLLLAALLGQDALAQYPFGKNKINYAKRKWKVLQTDNVDIYYYPSERDLATFAAPIVEETYKEFVELFDLEFRNRMPLVFFSSHYDFQQTNIVRSFISEGTGGFTDLIKGRIAIPFTGSLWHFRHVIRHEMVHAFMLEKLAQVMQEHNRFSYTQPPLWFIEGMAEYFAMQGRESTEMNMFIRDGLMHNRLPDLNNIWQIYGSFLMYKEGEAVCHYIADNFGDEAIIQILENWWVGETFEMVLQYTINQSVGELSDGFMKNLKRRHYPSIMDATFAPDIGRQLTQPRSYHARPAVARGSDGETKLYSNYAHDGVITIAELKWKDGTLDHRILVESARSASFEWIPASRSKLEARVDTLMFVAKRHERDAIYLLDARSGKQIEFHTFPELSIISSPTLSPSGDRIVFSAIDANGQMDLFVCTRATGKLVRLTDDAYGEQDPDFHPTDNRVVFSSDKCESRDRQHQGIYELDIETGVVTTLTCGTYSDAHPDWAPDGKSFIFSSDRDGKFNIYSYDYEAQLITRQTSVLGGLTTPVYLPDQSGFVSSGYYKGEFQLFEFPVKMEKTEANTMIAQTNNTSFGWTTRDAGSLNYTEQDYRTKLGIDFAGAGVAIDPDFGSVGNGAQLVLSDLLGNVQYGFLLGSSSTVDSDFWKRLNVGVSYTNIGSRMNYSLSFFHLISTVGNINTTVNQERRFGAAVGLSYPFSKFSRVDVSLVGRFVERLQSFSSTGFGGTTSVIFEDTPQSFIGSSFVTYVRDNTLWTVGGPLKGRRWYLTLGHTYDFRDRGFDNTTVQFDLRQYIKLSRRVVLAERFVTRHSWGGDFQIYYLGGPWDFRGYDVREFEGRSTYLLNSEIRFPLIDRFALALPVGNIEFPMFRGAIFFDVARVNRYIFDSDYLGSFGAGIELNLGYAPVFRVNFTRATDFVTISPDFKYELFIGYNY